MANPPSEVGGTNAIYNCPIPGIICDILGADAVPGVPYNELEGILSVYTLTDRTTTK